MKFGKQAAVLFMALGLGVGGGASSAQSLAKALPEQRESQRLAVRGALGYGPGHGVLSYGRSHPFDVRAALAHRLPAHKRRVLRRRGVRVRG